MRNVILRLSANAAIFPPLPKPGRRGDTHDTVRSPIVLASKPKRKPQAPLTHPRAYGNKWASNFCYMPSAKKRWPCYTINSPAVRARKHVALFLCCLLHDNMCQAMSTSLRSKVPDLNRVAPIIKTTSYRKSNIIHIHKWITLHHVFQCKRRTCEQLFYECQNWNAEMHC